jgi:hypothetical protein
MTPHRPPASPPRHTTAAPLPAACDAYCFEEPHAVHHPHGGADSPAVHAQLEDLDDAMFAAIGGSAAALDRARALWFNAVASLPWELVEESREQYLRYAAEVMQRAGLGTTRKPAAALAAAEILDLLARE